MVSLNSRTDRAMARIGMAILSLGLIWGAYEFGRPLYWRFYATVLRPFDSGAGGEAQEDPFASAFLEGGTTGSIVAPVVTEKAPFNPDNFPLTKERVQSYVQDGYIMVTWANHHYLDFARSWVHHVKKAGINGYLVGAMDDDILQALHGADIHTWRMNTGIHKGDLGWGSPNFHKMGRFKIALIKQFLDLEVTVVISDIDTAWLRNPYPFFNKYPEADVLTSTDELHETVPGEDLEKYPDAAAAFNIGIMMFRPSSKAFVEAWVKHLEIPNMWDQTAFNELARMTSGGPMRSEPPKNLISGWNDRIKFGILPASIYASGHMVFVQRKYEELGLQMVVAHATFQYSGTPGKRNRFREFQWWWDPDEYYDSAKGFLSFDYKIPDELWQRASQPVQGDMTLDKLKDHFDLVHWQLARLRTALALATISGRIIVMPRIWCQLDKYWAPLHNGNIPGSKFRKPFVCPMDHVLDIEGGWHPKRDEREWGPHIEWREYSFLENPRVRPEVNSSRITLAPCPPGDAACAQPAVESGRLKVDAGMDPKVLGAALAAGQFKVLHVPADAIEMLSPLWTRFAPEDKDRFQRRLAHYTSVFCCLQQNPGWLWYDFFWDIPHDDRMGRHFDEWHWKRGDQDDHKAPVARRQLRGAAAGGEAELGGGSGLVSMPRRQHPFLQHMEMDAMQSWP